VTLTHENSHFLFSVPVEARQGEGLCDGHTAMATITYTTDPVGTGALGTSQFLRSMSQKGRLQPNQFVYVSSLEDLGKLRLCVDSILVTINVDCLKCQVPCVVYVFVFAVDD
jgi:hypothetical protein